MRSDNCHYSNYSAAAPSDYNTSAVINLKSFGVAIVVINVFKAVSLCNCHKKYLNLPKHLSLLP